MGIQVGGQESSQRYSLLHSFCAPCGTASRAREIPLSAKDKAAGMHEPKPLRSDAAPDGIAGLVGIEAERVAPVQ